MRLCHLLAYFPYLKKYMESYKTTLVYICYNSSFTWEGGCWSWVWSLRISSGRTQALLRRGMFFLKKSLDHTFFKIICLIYFSPLHNYTWSQFTTRRPYTVQLSCLLLLSSYFTYLLTCYPLFYLFLTHLLDCLLRPLSSAFIYARMT
jgi:hypothetical protein